MSKIYYFLNIVGITFMLTSCRSTPMKSIQVKKSLPLLTTSKLILSPEAEAIKNNKCVYLSRGRIYDAPIKVKASNDLKHAAKGIDKMVQSDGGNSYVLINYKWIKRDDYGTFQLRVEFDTLRCE